MFISSHDFFFVRASRPSTRGSLFLFKALSVFLPLGLSRLSECKLGQYVRREEVGLSLFFSSTSSSLVLRKPTDCIASVCSGFFSSRHLGKSSSSSSPDCCFLFCSLVPVIVSALSNFYSSVCFSLCIYRPLSVCLPHVFLFSWDGRKKKIQESDLPLWGR